MPVDFIWDDGKPLREAIPANLVFDYVIASHVIEHAPDMIGWLRQVAGVLRTGGILSLAVPDKRFTFDEGRELTTLDQLLTANAGSVSSDRTGISWGHNQVFTFETFSKIAETLCSDGVIPFHIAFLFQRAESPFEFIVVLKRT